MNLRAVRGFFITTLALNVLLVSLMLLDYYYANSRFFSAILICFGVLVIITGVLMIFMLSEERKGEPAVQRAEPPAAALPEPEPEALPEAQPRPTRAAFVGELSPIDEAHAGPFVYEGYTLHARQVELKGGGERTIYFFSKRRPKSGEPVPKPEGYHVAVNETTGLPFLRKGAGTDGEDATPEREPHLRPQCSALTEAGEQCRNSARSGSKYCASHFGYQPPAIAKAEAERRDTTARVKDAPDTIPAVRKRRVVEKLS